MKSTWIILILLGFQSDAFATCKVSVANSGYGTKELKSILKSKGYELVDEPAAHQIFSINAASIAWGDGPETFSYAVPKITTTGIYGSENCPRLDQWKFFTIKPILQKRAAIHSMLIELGKKLP